MIWVLQVLESHLTGKHLTAMEVFLTEEEVNLRAEEYSKKIVPKHGDKIKIFSVKSGDSIIQDMYCEVEE